MDMNTLLAAWDEAHRELAIALDNFPGGDLWKRPHARLLSVGELAGHVAYGEATWTLGDGTYRPDLGSLAVQSPLISNDFSYYLSTVDQPLKLDLSAAEALAEVKRVHEACKAVVAAKSYDDAYPGQWGTWGNMVQYQVFHVAYHTGQAYSVRHLLGHETEDN